MIKFIEDKKNNWERLEDLLAILDSSSLRGLSKMEVRELGELYRRAAADLAIARAETRDQQLISYLNSLVIRAHGKIYRAESQGINLVWDFFGRELPQIFRANIRYFTLALVVFVGVGIASFLLSYYDVTFAESLGLAKIRAAAQSNDRWWMDLNDANQIGASGILTNNILVSFLAFAYGAFFGIGTIYILVMNGLSIGGVLGVVYKANPAFGNALVEFMIAHGVVELSCIFIAAGAGMMIGYAIVNPGDLTRGQALKKKGVEAVKLAIGCACFLVIAGMIEGFLSPSALPAWVKYATGILTGVLMYSYLFLVGRNESAVPEPPAA